MPPISSKQKLEKIKSPPLFLLFLILTITLYFSTKTFDPFNSPKQWILLVGAGWLSGYLRLIPKNIESISYKFLLTTLVFFLSFQYLSAGFSEDILMGLIGDVQRRNGAFTYTALAIVLIFTIQNCRKINELRFMNFILFINSLLATYGVMQINKLDFQKWNNPYNPLILTTGNPNFASSLLSIFGVLIYSFLYFSNISIWRRSYIVFLIILDLYLIKSSNSIQGLVNIFLGIGLISLFIMIKKGIKRIYLLGLLFIFITSVSLALLGIFQKGPLTELIYKDSVSVRGFYWRAALEMFRHNFLFGVGTDQYGSYFRLYREVGYPLKYGFEITSSNAHNIYLQFFATSGIFVGISYLLFLFIIFKSGIKKLLNPENKNQQLLIGVFCSWLCYCLQGSISIDNITLGIWGWFLGGLVFGLSDTNTSIQTDSKRETFSFLISFAICLPIFIFCALLARAEISMFNQSGYVQAVQTNEDKNTYRKLAQDVLNNPVADQAYRRSVGENLFLLGFQQEGLQVFNELISKHPNVNENYYARVVSFNNLARYNDAIADQKKIISLDPYGALNMYNLAENYKKIGNYVEMEKIKKQILNFAADTDIGKLAKRNLISP